MKAFIPFLLLLAGIQITHVQAQELFRAKTALSVNTGVYLDGLYPSRVFFEQEVVYWPKRGVSMGFRLGLGSAWQWANLSIGIENTWSGTLLGTATAYVLTGRKNHHFEAALGPELLIPSPEFFYPVVPYAEAGYRFQKPSSGFFVRGFIGSVSGLGVGVGYSFPVKNR
ncbi:MAG: hypothetical protein NW241_16295 [Bacteroidia bacterium]|nr:hypothetical protein [Bacteroidia bacterium]